MLIGVVLPTGREGARDGAAEVGDEAVPAVGVDVYEVPVAVLINEEVHGPAVMKAQLRELAEVAELPHVDLRVIPFEAGEKGASTGAFSLFATEKNGDVEAAFTEAADATTSLRDDPAVLRRLNRMFRNLSAAAFTPEATLELVQRIESEL
ncbi:Scr1 family TA system antitoxin-like transcriptional regulator [Streptomyces sp. NPDC127098]|uniref:Scr1 family TA system antitoxin-like transcriptional regulator n=1 Tax=Streptomyces sp. NPDC127098 TaxID=3347137 RepID=UPI0036517EB4